MRDNGLLLMFVIRQLRRVWRKNNGQVIYPIILIASITITIFYLISIFFYSDIVCFILILLIIEDLNLILGHI